jgi:hypothetical protein
LDCESRPFLDEPPAFFCAIGQILLRVGGSLSADDVLDADLG